MTAPKRPSLADTLARIGAAIAEPVSNPPCLRCARAALLGSPYCAAHERIPREMIEELGPNALRPYSQYVEDGVSHPPDPWFNAQLVDTEPEPERGWLARALRRLFT